MQFKTQADNILQFSEDAISVFKAFRQLDGESHEAGGIMLGRILLNEPDVIVDELTAPSAEDVATRFSFFRPIRLAQQKVVDAWRRSRGTTNYLGEWHTHPEDDPSPSSKDLANWQRISHKSKSMADELFFVIVGRTRTRAWSIRKGYGAAKHLEMIRR